MILHFLPDLGLGIVIAVLHSLYLLNVMCTVPQQETVHGIPRKVRICFAQEDSDFLGFIVRDCIAAAWPETSPVIAAAR